VATAQRAAEAIPMTRVCQALALSRATYDRWQPAKAEPDQLMGLRAQSPAIAPEMPTYGYLRLTYELQQLGFAVNHKRVPRLMGEDNSLCLCKLGFVRTTDSAHVLTAYPHLLSILTVNGLNHLWVADITYTRQPRTFMYLPMLLDAYSRRCIRRALDRYPDHEVALAALRMALTTRMLRPGLVHHSHRGVQYASYACTNLLKAYGLRISMSRTGNPYDNVQAESFIKTLKYEEVDLFKYQNFAEARGRSGLFGGEVYTENGSTLPWDTAHRV
jgi:putative transposase